MDVGVQIGKDLKPGSILCLRGDLAAGKTTLIKGIARGFADFHEDGVNSPTFVYLNIYEGKRTVYHFDLYRLNDPDEFVRMGFDEYLFTEGVCCIEWSERIAPILPSFDYLIELKHLGDMKRKIEIQHYG